MTINIIETGSNVGECGSGARRLHTLLSGLVSPPNGLPSESTSSKAILPILWQLFPDHPNLLPAYFSPEKLGKRYARKPMYGREGANVRLVDGLNVAESPGPYGAHGYVYQELFPLPIFGSPTFGNIHALVGSWVIGKHAAGIGIRESADVITPNIARFVPHVVQ